MQTVDYKAKYLKEHFSDCTFGGYDDNLTCYDIGLNEGFAHVDFNNLNDVIEVKLFNNDSNEIARVQFNDINLVIDYLYNK